MNRFVCAAGAAASLMLVSTAFAGQVPSSLGEVARPGGDLPGDPKIA